jgi:hypothetical protein
MGRRHLSFGFSIATAAAAALAFGGRASAGEVQVTCGADRVNDPAAQLAAAIDQAARAASTFVNDARGLDGSALDAYETPAYAGNGTQTNPTNLVYDIHAAHETEGKSGVVPTVAWTPAEQAEVQAITDRLPSCLVEASGVREQYRTQRGLRSAQTGILGIAYSYNNQGPHPGGRIVMTDLFFNAQTYGGMTGDQQMQAALGWRACYPPAGEVNTDANVRTRIAALPPQIRHLTRDRILFHEYIHGITHEQEGADWHNWASPEGFWGAPDATCPTCGASRYDALRARLFAPDLSTPESQHVADLKNQMGAIVPGPNARQQYCDLYAQLSDYMKAQGVPQRWPGDMHALDDKDEYITILVENAVHDPSTTFGANSPYSKAEQAWVRAWWSNTFGGAKLGTCAANPVASTDPGATPLDASKKQAAANAYAASMWYAAGYYGGF